MELKASITLEWERVEPNSYRAMEGRFTISRVNLGQCQGARWILVDNKSKQRESCLTLAYAKGEAESILLYEGIQGGDPF